MLISQRVSVDLFFSLIHSPKEGFHSHAIKEPFWAPQRTFQ